MIEAKIYQVRTNGVSIIIQPKTSGKLDIYPDRSQYSYKTSTGERVSEFKFINSNSETVRAIGQALIEAADFVDGLEEEKKQPGKI
jgi:hypothetical protein